MVAVVDEVAPQILVVRRHIEQSVTGKIEENHLLFAGFTALQGFADGSCDGVAGFRCRHYALRLREERSGVERFDLRNVRSLHHSVVIEL